MNGATRASTDRYREIWVCTVLGNLDLASQWHALFFGQKKSSYMKNSKAFETIAV